jgi:hypothetical protein
MMAKAEAVVAIHHIAQSYLPQVMAALLVVSALGQFVPRISAGHIGVAVGRIVSQQTAADQLLLLPHTEQTNLGLFQFFLLDAIKAVPELLGGESLRRQVPKRGQDGAVIPASHFGFGTRLTDTVDGGQQQIMRRRRTRAGLRPERLEEFKDAGPLSGEPQRTGQTHIESRGLQRDWRGAVFNQRGDLLGGAEIRLMDNAGLAVNAGALDDIVIEFVRLLLGDEGRHIG